LDAAARACNEGGTIILVGECCEGLGRDDFLKWFDAGSSDALAEVLCAKYQVNGQTAWSLMQKAERFNVKILSTLPRTTVERLGLSGLHDLSQIGQERGPAGYVIPNGAKIHIEERVPNPL
jgi:hypothetical protein